ncbi:Cytochrome oxidase assembly, partial [Polyrhizophydium stewartii]
MAMQAALRRLARRASKSPLAFGVPFMGMVVLGAYGLSFLTQVKYDYIDAKYRT